MQFDHRLLATLTALSSPPRACRAAAAPAASGPGRAACMGAGVLAQYSLGVATLLWVVPVGLATAHQAVAILLLTATLATMHVQRYRA